MCTHDVRCRTRQVQQEGSHAHARQGQRGQPFSSLYPHCRLSALGVASGRPRTGPGARDRPSRGRPDHNPAGRWRRASRGCTDRPAAMDSAVCSSLGVSSRPMLRFGTPAMNSGERNRQQDDHAAPLRGRLKMSSSRRRPPTSGRSRNWTRRWPGRAPPTPSRVARLGVPWGCAT